MQLLNLSKITILLLSVLACAIQTQILFGETDTYMGLRINLGDFIIPIAGIIIVTSLALKKSVWPKWQKPSSDIWFFSLLGVIIIGLINAYTQYGTISNWALLNRGIGWGVLTGYIYFAGWGITNFGEKALYIYLRSFLLFAISIIIIGTVWFLFTQYGTKQGGNLNYQALSGFLGNRNAFAFLMFCTVVIYTYLDFNKIKILPRFQVLLTHALWLAIPLAMMFNGSRAGWIGMFLIILWFLVTKFKYTILNVTPAILASLIVITAMYALNPSSVFRENQGEKLSDIKSGELIHGTDTLRITVAKEALDLWSQKKLLGSGIGGFLTYQEEKHGKILDQIDNSALWILTELGILGATIFGLFFLIIFISLWKTYKTQENIYGVFAQAMMVIMVLFALYSLVHQILYARYLWFFLGLALAIPKPNKAE